MGRRPGRHRDDCPPLGIGARIGPLHRVGDAGSVARSVSTGCAHPARPRMGCHGRRIGRTRRSPVRTFCHTHRLDLVGADRFDSHLRRRIWRVVFPVQYSRGFPMNESKVIELRRDLGLWGAISIVVGTVIGSGIFLVPRAMVLRVGSPSMVFVVWVFGGLLSLCGALSYAELAAAMPEAGGEYVYLREAYGPLWGFLYGWTQMWVAKSGSIATLATAFFYYLTNFFPLLDGVFYTVPLPLGAHGAPLDLRYGQLLAMALILFLAGVNYFGVKLGGEVQIIVTIVKVLLIAFIVVAGLGFGKAHAPAPASVPHPRVFPRRGWRLGGPTMAEITSAGWLPRPASRSAACRWRSLAARWRLS